jgi:hypothetical protein
MRVIALLAFGATPLLGQDTLPLSDARWQLAGDSTRIERVGGREALRMFTGSATRRDILLQDGTIDVDVMTTRRRSFVYVRFRMEDENNHEEFYLRPHKSELPDAVQYAPVFRGQSAWQLYHGARGTAAPAFQPGVWTRVRIALAGERAAFFVADTSNPVLVVRMAREPRRGYLSISAFLPPGTPGSGAIAWFSNVRVRPGVAYAFREQQDAPLPSGVVRQWSVGPSFLPATLEPTTLDPAWTATMQTVTTEPNGMVELNRWIAMPEGRERSPTGDVGTVARLRVTAEQAGDRRMELGFSDAATVFLNGRPLFHRDDSYVFLRRRDGLIAFDQASVFLPLNAGVNDLAIVVTDHFGGWGLMGRFPDTNGLTVEPWQR